MSRDDCSSIDRASGPFICVLLSSLVLGCASTSSSTKNPSPEPAVRTSVDTGEAQEPAPPAAVDEPSQEELATSPCGNPDWAQLPPDSDIDGDRKTDSEQQSPSSQESDEDPADGSDDVSNEKDE